MTVPEFLSQFKEPDPRFSPVPAWWWSGEKLDIAKMRWQMDQLRAMGLRNFVVIGLAPSGAMFGSDADDPSFLSEPWWDIFRQVCDYAQEIGLYVWFYDQIGFSGANFQTELVAAHPEWSAQRLKSVSVEGEGTLEVRCPDVGTPIGAYFIAGGDVTAVQVVDRTAQFVTQCAGRLQLVYSILQAYDYFNPTACQALLDTVHREFARRLPNHIGKTIVGSFQDELPELPTWGATFADSFAGAFGYRLEDNLHHLFEPGDAAARKTRLNYHQHRANLAETAFFKPFFEWHEQYGMICGYDQQSPAREARLPGCVEKYADYLQTQRWYGAPGSDLHGNGKLHSSIAFLNNRKRVWLEGFHSTGWGGTIADTFDWLLPYLQSGVTLYNPHAIYYSTNKGWWEWAPPSTCWRQPYAMHYRPFAEMIARLTKLLSHGVHQATVGVLFPTATAQSEIGAEVAFDGAKHADETLHGVLGSMRWHQVKTGALDAAAIDHHVLDESAIQEADVADGSLIVHGVPLKAIVLPGVTMLHGSTLEKLAEFARTGGQVVVVASPGVRNEHGVSVEWNSYPAIRQVANPDDLLTALAGLDRAVTADVPVLHRKAGGLNILLVPAVSGMATVVKWDSWFAPMEHTTIVPERYREQVDVRLSGAVGQPHLFDPRTGHFTPMNLQRDGDHTRVLVAFDGSPMAVIVWSEGHAAESAEIKPGLKTSVVEASWTGEYLPTLPNEFADIYDPARPQQRLPTTPKLKWKQAAADAGLEHGLPADAEVIVAGFGPRGRVQYADGRVESLSYSLRYGIDHDKLHALTLGPKAHVPEEFIDLGKLTAGDVATVQFAVEVPKAQDVLFIAGANAYKAAKINGEHFAANEDKYAWLRPVRLKAGRNDIELILTARTNTNVRAFWCLADPADADRLARPERLIAPTKPEFGQRLRFIKVLRSDQPVRGGTILVSSAAMLTLTVGGELLGRQGGFDPYRLQMRGQRYVMPTLPPGEFEIVIEVTSPASVAPVLLDAEIETDAGIVRLRSDRTWAVSVDGGPAEPVAVQMKQDADGAAWHLYRRPHPLPQTAWLDGGRPGVIDVHLTPPSDETRPQWLEWTIPPGAETMRIDLVDASDTTLWIDGEPLPLNVGADVDLPAGPRAARRAVLRTHSRQLGGGLLATPITYRFSTGDIRLGNWIDQGLASYSGAIRMTAKVPVDAIAHTGQLDLGQVRGTVEAFVNGQSAGVRFMSPYRFDLSGLATVGENKIELVVTNTLVNHISTWSPTRWWSPDQLNSGVFGPLTIRYSEA